MYGALRRPSGTRRNFLYIKDGLGEGCRSLLPTWHDPLLYIMGRSALCRHTRHYSPLQVVKKYIPSQKLLPTPRPGYLEGLHKPKVLAPASAGSECGFVALKGVYTTNIIFSIAMSGDILRKTMRTCLWRWSTVVPLQP